MTYIPGWPSLTEVLDPAKQPHPFPGSISDFDDWISKFSNGLEDAKAQLRRNSDANRLEHKDKAEEEAYIRRLQRMMAELRRKGKKIDETFELNIANAREKIEECDTIIGKLHPHREIWTAERNERARLLKWFRGLRRAGINPKTKQPRECRALNLNGSRCQNPKHYRGGSNWGPCPTHAP